MATWSWIRKSSSSCCEASIGTSGPSLRQPRWRHSRGSTWPRSSPRVCLQETTRVSWRLATRQASSRTFTRVRSLTSVTATRHLTCPSSGRSPASWRDSAGRRTRPSHRSATRIVPWWGGIGCAQKSSDVTPLASEIGLAATRVRSCGVGLVTRKLEMGEISVLSASRGQADVLAEVSRPRGRIPFNVARELVGSNGPLGPPWNALAESELFDLGFVRQRIHACCLLDL
mmetsp:Transcript_24655/g.61685  ORF Transcript_24655/g.61685 Transcript_24655/m.61685 type:complete len:229 (-) Transcript_24655:139-825(-)